VFEGRKSDQGHSKEIRLRNPNGLSRLKPAVRRAFKSPGASSGLIQTSKSAEDYKESPQ